MGLGNIFNIQYNKIDPISKSTKSGELLVIEGQENFFFAPFIPSIFPLIVLDDACLRYIIFPQPASNFHQRKKHHCVRYPFFREISIKIDEYLPTRFMLDALQGGDAHPNSPNTGFTCKWHYLANLSPNLMQLSAHLLCFKGP